MNNDWLILRILWDRLTDATLLDCREQTTGSEGHVMGAQHPASHVTRLLGATLTAGALLLAPIGVAIATPSIAHAAPPPGGGGEGTDGSGGTGGDAKPTKARDQRGAVWRAAQRDSRAAQRDLNPGSGYLFALPRAAVDAAHQIIKGTAVNTRQLIDPGRNVGSSNSGSNNVGFWAIWG